jgi:hypothetical protein
MGPARTGASNTPAYGDGRRDHKNLPNVDPDRMSTENTSIGPQRTVRTNGNHRAIRQSLRTPSCRKHSCTWSRATKVQVGIHVTGNTSRQRHQQRPAADTGNECWYVHLIGTRKRHQHRPAADTPHGHQRFISPGPCNLYNVSCHFARIRGN